MKNPRAAAHRTLRFVCGSTTAEKESQQKSVAGIAPKLKRQRVNKPLIVEVRLVELIGDISEASDNNDKYYGLFLWTSALLLSRFVAYNSKWLCRDNVVLELGCGTGLPSLLAGLCGALKVYMTDRASAGDVPRNVAANIALNGLEACATYLPLVWGDMHLSEDMMTVFQGVHVVLAADCFYESKAFEKVLATVALIFRCSSATNCKFYFAYQLRSIDQSIAPILSRWGLTAQSIDKRTYINDEIEMEANVTRDFDSIYLYEVQLCVAVTTFKTSRELMLFSRVARVTSRIALRRTPSTALRTLETRQKSSLASLLEREIREEKGNSFEEEELEQLRLRFEKVFKLKESPECMNVVLQGTVGSDSIKIHFNAQDTVELDEDEDYSDDEEESNEQDEEVDDEAESDDEEDELPGIRFTADILRNNKGLQFDCVATSNLTIERLRFFHDFEKNDKNESQYYGPDFIDLELDVQDKFYSYLADRHIDDDLAQFITQYADLKEQREYLAFLENAESFVKN
ncbi:hypothetical protein CCR75_003949 [Bremia lactucae]|uniref:Uncharacterized protein n=1 Tax=Bremia lactucae TaxID=4779 RepID=A0A976IFG8_BRELC|nr:hypothetical protein CCR75_003949 [Bremia lactucae]